VAGRFEKGNAVSGEPEISRAKGLIEIDAIIVAYAMSRLDRGFLAAFGYNTWKVAFEATGTKLNRKAASMKNLRDEFDPVHGNARAGWDMRPMRPNRQRVLGEFCTVSDAALIEVVQRILRGDREVRAEITEPILVSASRAENVAERLRTGREAERYFVENAETICGIPRHDIVDVRDEARGYDFAVSGRSSVGIEVKGLRLARGEVLFTDHEWDQAHRRRSDYWLVVVGCLNTQPVALMLSDPTKALSAKSVVRQTASVSWRARVRVA
jgi:hypothetical protein